MTPLEYHRSSVIIPLGPTVLYGDLVIPNSAQSIVLFAHGTGIGRQSPRNQYVAQGLQESGIATLLMDLLTKEEESIDENTGHLRFDIGMLAKRLTGATDWVAHHLNAFDGLKIGYFGASTGAAAALIAAAQKKDDIQAVVSRGGRPDLAKYFLEQVKAPTLLIVGGNDDVVIDLNRVALDRLASIKELKVIPGATHLFEEPGTLDQVREFAKKWFLQYLVT